MTLLLTGLLGGAPAPAWATDDIGLSHDGELWADALTEPLFDAETTWVPGDARTVSFYVRNEAESDALLTAAVLADGDDTLGRTTTSSSAHGPRATGSACATANRRRS